MKEERKNILDTFSSISSPQAFRALSKKEQDDFIRTLIDRQEDNCRIKRTDDGKVMKSSKGEMNVKLICKTYWKTSIREIKKKLGVGHDRLNRVASRKWRSDCSHKRNTIHCRTPIQFTGSQPVFIDETRRWPDMYMSPVHSQQISVPSSSCGCEIRSMKQLPSIGEVLSRIGNVPGNNYCPVVSDCYYYHSHSNNKEHENSLTSQQLNQLLRFSLRTNNNQPL